MLVMKIVIISYPIFQSFSARQPEGLEKANSRVDGRENKVHKSFNTMVSFLDQRKRYLLTKFLELSI